jgi:hypothetical protein
MAIFFRRATVQELTLLEGVCVVAGADAEFTSLRILLDILHQQYDTSRWCARVRALGADPKPRVVRQPRPCIPSTTPFPLEP